MMHSTRLRYLNRLRCLARSSKVVDLDEQDALVTSHLAKLRKLASMLQSSSGAQGRVSQLHHTGLSFRHRAPSLGCPLLRASAARRVYSKTGHMCGVVLHKCIWHWQQLVEAANLL